MSKLLALVAHWALSGTWAFSGDVSNLAAVVALDASARSAGRGVSILLTGCVVARRAGRGVGVGWLCALAGQVLTSAVEAFLWLWLTGSARLFGTRSS
jgi:hypothetical protein